MINAAQPDTVWKPINITKSDGSFKTQLQNGAGFILLPADFALTQGVTYFRYIHEYAFNYGEFLKGFQRVFEKLLELNVQEGLSLKCVDTNLSATTGLKKC